MEEISLKNVIARKKEMVTADMDGETVMMSIENGKYYNLGQMGSVIWDLLEAPISAEALIMKLMEKYEVSRQQCETETLAFLNGLIKEGLLETK